jgi:hypothetical protein
MGKANGGVLLALGGWFAFDAQGWIASIVGVPLPRIHFTSNPQRKETKSLRPRGKGRIPFQENGVSSVFEAIGLEN